MFNIYKSFEDRFVSVREISDGVWVNMKNPTPAEITEISEKLSIDKDFLNAALDEEERSRIEIDDETGDVLIVVDIPILVKENQTSIYETVPLAIILTKLAVITVCLKDNLVIRPFIDGKIKTFYTYKKSRFILQILYNNASLYLSYLKQIDKIIDRTEAELNKTMRNKELTRFLTIEKSLVYFTTSLKSNEMVMERLLRYDFFSKYPDDTELLEDTIIENKQAIEMSKIYREILSSTMDAFGYLISNNLNMVMKRLTSITIVMAIPTIISSFFGMNVFVPLQNVPGLVPFILICIASVIVCFITIRIMSKRDMF